jgi:hypothetical protein
LTIDAAAPATVDFAPSTTDAGPLLLSPPAGGVAVDSFAGSQPTMLNKDKVATAVRTRIDLIILFPRKGLSIASKNTTGGFYEALSRLAR